MDGQQRITSFLLLLRAFYSHLNGVTVSTDSIQGLMIRIGGCLFECDRRTLQPNFVKIHLDSRVALDEEVEILHTILKTGAYAANDGDKYSLNYRFFVERVECYATRDFNQFENLCLFLLDKCVILPIECQDSDNALTIFDTLNDRGLPLEAVDIFKAKLYQNCKEEERKAFIERWSDMTKHTHYAGWSMENLFRLYMHILRAKEGTTKNEIALKTFFTQNKCKRLFVEDLLPDLKKIIDFLAYIKDKLDESYITEGVIDKKYRLSPKTHNWVNMLCFWVPKWEQAYTVITLMYLNQVDNFDGRVCNFCRSFSAYLAGSYIANPRPSYKIKYFTYKMNVSLAKKIEVSFAVDFNQEAITSDNIKEANKVRNFLYLEALLNQPSDVILGGGESLEIEHILPKHWQRANYNNWTKEYAKQYLESFGNKVILEKPINKKVKDHAFSFKQQHYAKSSIQTVQDLLKVKSQWTKDDVEAREEHIFTTIINFVNNELELNS